jgi:aspartokinase
VTQDKDLLVVAAEDATALGTILERHGAWPRELWCEGPSARLAIVPLENVHGLPALLRDLQGSTGIHVEEGLAQVSVVGSGIGASREALERARRALGMEEPAPPGTGGGQRPQHAIEPRAVLVSPLRISALVPRGESDACVRRLHAEFVRS